MVIIFDFNFQLLPLPRRCCNPFVAARTGSCPRLSNESIVNTLINLCGAQIVESMEKYAGKIEKVNWNQAQQFYRERIAFALSVQFPGLPYGGFFSLFLMIWFWGVSESERNWHPPSDDAFKSRIFPSPTVGSIFHPPQLAETVVGASSSQSWFSTFPLVGSSSHALKRAPYLLFWW